MGLGRPCLGGAPGGQLLPRSGSRARSAQGLKAWAAIFQRRALDGPTRQRTGVRIFMIGATGYIGSNVAAHMMAHGHRVTGLSRSLTSDEALARRDIQPWRGD